MMAFWKTALLSETRPCPAVGTSCQVKASPWRAPAGQSRSLLPPPALAPVVVPQDVPLSLPGSRRTSRAKEIALPFHPFCWSIAKWCVSLYKPSQARPALGLQGSCQHQAFPLAMCAAQTENVPAVKRDRFRALVCLISYICQGDTILKCPFPLDISKTKNKTKHLLGVRENSPGGGVAAGICGEKGVPGGWCCSWRSQLRGSPPAPEQRATQSQAEVLQKLISLTMTVDRHQLP